MNITALIVIYLVICYILNIFYYDELQNDYIDYTLICVLISVLLSTLI